MNKRSFYGMIGRVFPRLGQEIRILMYHRVNPSENLPDRQISLTPLAFEQHLDWLQNRDFSILSLTEAVRQIQEKQIKHPKQVVLTFDDGFRDNYEHAFPILQRFGFTAEIFLTVDPIGNHPDFLDWDQVKEMQESGIHFGNHTLTHPKLSSIPESEAHEEISQAQKKLEQKLGKKITSFAYPSGRFLEIHRQILMQTEHKMAVTIAPGGNQVGTDPFLLRRTEITPWDTLFDFGNKMYGGFDWRHRRIQTSQGLLPIPQGA